MSDLNLAGRISRSKSAKLPRLAMTVVLWLTFALMVSSAMQKSPTVDEQSHLFRGVAYLKAGATHFLLGHPLFGSTLSAIPVMTEPGLQLPVDDPSWSDGIWPVAADLFLWRINESPQRIIFLGRLANVWLTLLLGALVFRWGQQIAGPGAGLLAATLLLLDPNVMAHGSLVTTDMPLTFFYALTCYGFWRYARAGSWQAVLLTGAGLGMAAAAKYSAALLLPVLGLLALYLAWRRRKWRPLFDLLWIGLAAWATIWIVYRLEWRPLPGGAFWDDLFWVIEYFGKEHGAYLLGEYAPNGWWYYFPVAFILKTPLPSLILYLWAVVQGVILLVKRLRQKAESTSYDKVVFLSVPAAVYAAASLTASLNIGYRHLLPLLPFLLLLAVPSLSATASGWQKKMMALIGVWAIIIGLTTWPDYIPYFNPFAGGPENSWRLLSDSNIDWGQDLPALAEWQAAQTSPMKLSFFGMAHPSAYGIKAELLPTWTPALEQAPADRLKFDPADPAPGLYAISVTNLHGIVLGENRDAFDYFRDKAPVARIGGSIFVYEVAPIGPPADVAFYRLRPWDLDRTLHENLGTNDVRVRWFDAGTSFIWPADGGWMAVPSGVEPTGALRPFWPAAPVLTSGEQRLYRLPSPPALNWQRGGVDLEGKIRFLGYERVDTGEDQVTLMTAWQVIQETDRPLKIFVHALDADGQIVGQWDGLHLDPISWLPGDVFVQFHSFAVPHAGESEEPGAFGLSTGIYDGETGIRISSSISLED